MNTRPTLSLRPWTGSRLQMPIDNLREVSDLADVGAIGKERIAATVEYLECLKDKHIANNHREERKKELARKRALTVKNRAIREALMRARLQTKNQGESNG